MMYGQHQQEVSRIAEQGITQGIEIAARATANVVRMLLYTLLYRLPQLWRRVRQGVSDERRRLQGMELPEERNQGEKQERRGLPRDGESQRRGQTDPRQESRSDRSSARGLLDKVLDWLYQLLPQETKEKVSKEEFRQAYRDFGADKMRQERQVHEEYIKRRWGPDANMDNVWKQTPRTPEDALIVWASAATNNSPEATKKREQAEATLRQHAPGVMRQYDLNRKQGADPWNAMNDAYQAERTRTQNAGRTNTQSNNRSNTQTNSQGSSQTSNQGNNTGQGTSQPRNRPPTPARPALPVGDAVGRGRGATSRVPHVSQVPWTRPMTRPNPRKL
ncbi:hypothetical protein J4H86_06695 [Spiractinospora alimapuensis]|uniref:hypothetical protein n=1 Tax=Spiractinospora alimapuensis TaxID=2820884 RepID=UPI001F3C5940|nr:hypothetical protein [Spiractinospora alimapuensis]QVQ53441.1 hypothetical protein J4H86_06695 [Spiractinospora alimapuensis]